jgi:hypothetical protein
MVEAAEEELGRVSTIGAFLIAVAGPVRAGLVDAWSLSMVMM